MEETAILLIYTGGTIGMIADEETGTLIPFDFDNINNHIPELKRFRYKLGFHCFDPLLDSSNMNVETWIELGQIIKSYYEDYLNWLYKLSKDFPNKKTKRKSS